MGFLVDELDPLPTMQVADASVHISLDIIQLMNQMFPDQTVEDDS